jgi:hypothetical protein
LNKEASKQASKEGRKKGRKESALESETDALLLLISFDAIFFLFSYYLLLATCIQSENFTNFRGTSTIYCTIYYSTLGLKLSQGVSGR